MLKVLKKITIQLIAGANIATVIIMFLIGFSDYISPASHPYLSNIGLAFPVFLIINFVFLIFWILFYIKGIWIPILGYLLCIVPIRIYFPINIQGKTPEGCIKILSYNVFSFAPNSIDDSGNYPIIEYIKHSNADIVCLQEANDGSVKKDYVDSILEKYKYKDTTQVGYHHNVLAIYSRFPILSKEKIAMKSENNGSVAYKLKINGDTVIVINNHLESNQLTERDKASYKRMFKKFEHDTVKVESKRLIEKLGDASKIRCHQADAVANYIKEHEDKDIILCGDFNDNPISYTRRVIASTLNDCYVSSGNGIGLSYNQRGFYVRIDNIMASSGWKAYNCRVDNKIDASDHYPIYCSLKKK